MKAGRKKLSVELTIKVTVKYNRKRRNVTRFSHLKENKQIFIGTTVKLVVVYLPNVHFWGQNF